MPPNKKRYEEYLASFVPEIITKQKHLEDVKMYFDEIEILEEEFYKEFNLNTDLTRQIEILEEEFEKEFSLATNLTKEIEILEEEFAREFSLVTDLTKEVVRLENLLKTSTRHSNCNHSHSV